MGTFTLTLKYRSEADGCLFKHSDKQEEVSGDGICACDQLALMIHNSIRSIQDCEPGTTGVSETETLMIALEHSLVKDRDLIVDSCEWEKELCAVLESIQAYRTHIGMI